jgi:hypothetical protein
MFLKVKAVASSALENVIWSSFWKYVVNFMAIWIGKYYSWKPTYLPCLGCMMHKWQNCRNWNFITMYKM